MQAKDIIREIMRQKYEMRAKCNKPLLVEMSKRVYEILANENAILKWKENFPCALYLHEDICGLPIKIVENKELEVVEA